MARTHVLMAARMVRISSLAFAVALLVGFVALQSFSHEYGVPTKVLVTDSSPIDTALSAAIFAQESAGLTCREKPALTDVVLFQGLHDSTVTVLTFDAALAASTAHEGWIRRYCV